MTSRSFIVISPKTTITLIQHPDNHVINPETEMKIDNIRSVIKNIAQKPFQRSYKLVCIDPTEKISIEAQNTLLKTLEEPPPQTYIFLGTRNKSALLDTIISRCQPIDIKTFESSSSPFLEMDISDNTIVTPIQTDHIPEFPKNFTIKDAMEFAEKNKKMERDDVLLMLTTWSEELMKDPVNNAEILQRLIITQDKIAHNTNIQLTLESFLLALARQ